MHLDAPADPGQQRDRQLTAEVLAAVPFMGRLLPIMQDAVARPSRVTGERYNRVSAAFWGAVHDALAGETEAGAGLAELAGQLATIRRRGW